MTGEMYAIDPITATEPDGSSWPAHAAMAAALRDAGLDATVQPFDQYQGPYVLVGPDVRVGEAPYQLAVQELGVVRLWLCDDGLYREDTGEMLPRAGCLIPDLAAEAALELMGLLGVEVKE